MVKLDRVAPFDIDDPAEIAEVQQALADGVVLIVHPTSQSVWQVEGGTLSGANIRLLKGGQSELIKVAEMVVDDPAEINAAATH